MVEMMLGQENVFNYLFKKYCLHGLVDFINSIILRLAMNNVYESEVFSYFFSAILHEVLW